MPANVNDILHFWREAGASKWFKKSARFDDAIALKFEPVHHAAARGEYDAWIATAEGALALLLLLDQFPRNLYRHSAHAFATDGKARAIARAAVACGFHRAVEPELRQFMVLPFEHSEDMADQDEAARLAAELADPNITKWVDLHRDIIVRFGRFPHRNAALGRVTTPKEQQFLDEGGFSG
ncbi:DUF924 family protein [Phenylobacterium sp.]|uniref:DUF924 family protein n=1 Tax=Phenylobacterium sp. TaxID=1871053 RepID=UPI002DE992B3|nr:DUF924 family protein [Phenylobacterium sp.]